MNLDTILKNIKTKERNNEDIGESCQGFFSYKLNNFDHRSCHYAAQDIKCKYRSKDEIYNTNLCNYKGDYK